MFVKKKCKPHTFELQCKQPNYSVAFYTAVTNRRRIYYWLVAAACIRSCGTDTVGCRNLIATCLSPCHIPPSNYLEGMHFFDVNNTITYTTKFNLILRSLAPPQKVSPGITILRHRPRTYALKRTCTARARSCLVSGVLPHRKRYI